MSRSRHLVSLSLALLIGCGGAPVGTTTPSGRTTSFAGQVASLRARASADPGDAELARQLATYEQLVVDGDPARVGPTLERAIALSPADPWLTYLRTRWLARHGELDESDELALHTLELASRSTDPRAPFVAEVVADDLVVDVGHPEVTERRRERIRALLASPGRIGVVATGFVAEAVIDDALRRGSVDEARAAARAVGCVDRYQVAGPFGPREQLGFDREFAAAGVGPMAASYVLGPMRGEQPSRSVPTRGCGVVLGGGPLSGPGTTYAETFVDVPVETDAYVLLATPNSVALRLDGTELARLDRRLESQPTITVYRVHLTAGRHEFEVKIGSRHSSPFLLLRLVGEDGLALTGASRSLPAVAELPSPTTPDGIYLRARVLEERGATVAARDLLGRLLEHGDGAPEVLAAHASLLFADPIRPADLATDEARAELRALAEKDQADFLPALQLARLAASEGRTDEAIASLREISERLPEVEVLTLTLVELLAEEGFEAEAERRLAALSAAHPSDCSVLATRRRLARAMDRELAVARLAEAMVACDARSDARLDTAMVARDWDAVEREIIRLEGLALDGDVTGFLPARLRLARARGDAAAEAEVLARVRARYPRADGPILAEVDALVAAGRREEALARLDAVVDSNPSAFAPLRNLRSSLSLAHAMQPYRLDGLAAIEEYRASGVSYDAPAVYVLDYAAARVFPDGSYFYLVHQVVQVNSEEALDDVGEFRPREGELLRVRTIKRDGRLLEPDVIAGMPSLALPRLEVGDFVEYEYVLSEGPSEALEAGVLSHRFYFRSFDGPLHRTEYLVVVPDGVDVTFDRRGPLPDPEVSRSGDATLHRFRMDRQEKPEPEPFSVNPREYMPSVSWGIGARWSAFRDTLADQLSGTMQRDPELVRATERVIREAGARTDREKAVALYHWVLDNIEGEGSGLFDSAPGMLYDRNGNRDRVLQYMLALVGIDSDLVLVRSVEADQTPSELPEDDTYDAVALRLALASGPTFVTTKQRGVPFGWLPSGWLGQPAMVVREDGAMLTMPATSPVEDRRAVTIDAEMQGDGLARLEVVETFTGSAAGGWRMDLEQVPAAELEMRFESAYIAPRFPGGRLVSVAIENAEAPERPFVLRYVVEAPLAFPDGDDAVVAVPMPFEIGGALASTAQRTTDALLPQVATAMVLRIRLPSGATVSALPPPAEVAGPAGASFRASSRLDGRRLVIERVLGIRRARIAAGDYAALARFARSADREEARPIRLRLP